MTAFYNEIDEGAALWLEELIRSGEIAPGVVDRRDIRDIRPDEIAEFTQCHFFAGIGGWSLALRLAGWPDDRPVWTGSCPCQPFSAAGRRSGTADERHLWPFWFHLIEVCRPQVVFGEQVASKDGLGWFDLVYADLEGAGYAPGAEDRCAAGYGAPHIRQRLFFGAYDLRSAAGWLQHPESHGRREWRPEPGGRRAFGGRGDVGLADGELLGRDEGQPRDGGAEEGAWREPRLVDDRRGAPGGMVHGLGEGLEGHAGHGDDRHEPGWDGAVEVGSASPASGAGWPADGDGRDARAEGLQRGGQHGLQPQDGRAPYREPAALPTDGFWRDADWLLCRDGKWRPVEPGTFPLAHGVSGRVGLLRGYGNAIVPQVAAAWIAETEAQGREHLRLMSDLTTDEGIFA